MKRRSGILFLLALFLLQSVASAFPNEPQGFRGMRWGESVASVRDKKGEYGVQFYRKGKNADVYYIVLKGSDCYLGDVFVDDLYAAFWQDKLYRTTAYISGNGSREKAAKRYAQLKDYATDSFGPPDEERRVNETTLEARWLGEQTRIILRHQDSREKLMVPCVILILYNPPLSAERQQSLRQIDW